MKYMVVSTFKESVLNEKVMTAWANEKPQEGVTRLGTWHVGAGTGRAFSLFETTDLLSLTDFLMQYQDLLNIESYAVADDAETKKHYSI